MTRDRKFGEVRLEDRHFIIVDTGGITEETDDVGKMITQQALQAIEDADKIFFWSMVEPASPPKTES